MDPAYLLKLAKNYLKSRNRNRDQEAEIKRKVDIYRSLISDERYKEVLADLFTKKIAEKSTAILNIPLANTADEIGREYTKLSAEKKVFEDLLKAPDNYFRENEKLKIVEDLERQEAANAR